MTASTVEKIDAPAVRVASTVDSKIRAGIVGAGLMGLWHADALKRAGGTVVGFADFNISKAARLAAKYQNAKAFNSAKEMLAVQKLDVLHICLPTESHMAAAETAIESGIHLLIEKPLAVTAEETSKLYDLAARHKTLLCPVHQFIFQDGTVNAAKFLPRAGRLVHLEANINSAGGAGFDDVQLDQIAADILPHPLSLIQKFLGTAISEIEWKVLHSASGELRIFGRTRETSVSIFISMNARPIRNSFYLFGNEGTIYLDLFHGYSVIQSGKSSRASKILQPFDLAMRNFSAAATNLAWRTVRREAAYPGLRRLIKRFYGAIESDSEPPITPSEAIVVAEIRDLLIAQAVKSEK